MQPTSRHTESRHTKSIIPHKLVFVWCLLSAKKKNVCLGIVWMHNTHCIITSLSGKTVLETSIIRYGCLRNIPKTFSVHFLFYSIRNVLSYKRYGCLKDIWETFLFRVFVHKSYHVASYFSFQGDCLILHILVGVVLLGHSS